MIIFGSGDRLIRGEKLGGFQCLNCKGQQFTALGFIRHFHLYRIPTFPVSKRVAVECCQCKERLIRDEFPAYIANRIRENIFNAKNIAPSFIGLLIIAFILIAMVLGYSFNQAQLERYIAKPAINDIYIIDNYEIFDRNRESYRYAAMMITRVANDEAEFVLSKYTYSKSKGIDRDIAAKYMPTWGSNSVVFTREELASFHQAGAIYDISRNGSD
ncbi:hypothetical protein K6Y31_13190 [Motilimonas cestriensis]|uniref:Zinc-ribbon 15 domain-containing protein n=1 Tax=Motilimonas cestriensis TaxID=2742685 RepID=A0ABS8WEI3_9GAMM|nr:hypothetical protein [Motilimonas cestriensis]MCE2595760.1 hypothetical protein [Motilimonas cestriensis]